MTDAPRLFNHSSEFIDRAGGLTLEEVKMHGPALAIVLIRHYRKEHID
jgi:UDP-N-acetylglucosamine:LPS N-acetylglucosamine transferase